MTPNDLLNLSAERMACLICRIQFGSQNSACHRSPPRGHSVSLRCKTCKGEMVQKSRIRLITVGLAEMGLIAIAFRYSWFLAPGIILFLTGAYLLVWGTVGRGAWCRTCKRFSFF